MTTIAPLTLSGLSTVLVVLIPAAAALSGVVITQWQARKTERERREHDERVRQSERERDDWLRIVVQRQRAYEDFLVTIERLRVGTSVEGGRALPRDSALVSELLVTLARVRLVGAPNCVNAAEVIQELYTLGQENGGSAARLTLAQARQEFIDAAQVDLGVVRWEATQLMYAQVAAPQREVGAP